ncbi:MAG: AIPR family protein [Euryarchaeota archaeon]|nr:AIPR family protein [Euryarchaeota archaeon]MBU4339355.1 AIPR family protein [Euryarchaeota archaeon]MCG2735735.1 AIPR family protein [Candidatus Methanoperedenaceae archaeon]
MGYKDIDELIKKLSEKSNEATKKLTEFYANARFKIKSEDFHRQYTDGSDDGGIDFYHNEDTTFFIFQTKFSGTKKAVSESEILDEMRKIKNTLLNENPNKEAEDFVNSVKREIGNKNAILEIVWLTTNIVKTSTRDEIQKELNDWRKDNGWSLGIEFIAIDKPSLESVLYDIKHGYIPYTGKRTLNLEKGQWIETTWEETGIYSIACTINVNDILKWFRNSDDINRFLQKNVREFLGDTNINKDISKSYLESPTWFWYKHNGIIIFADNMKIDEINSELILRNPQIVNGGQTLKALFSAYDKNKRSENPAKIMLRIYRLPYEDTKTYVRSVEVIAALNSQNKIYHSDLRSNDPRQVRLEQLFVNISSGYKYLRKRSKEAKSGRNSITMRNLALRYYICMKSRPHEGVGGNVEELFEEDTKYNEIFDENSINRDLSGTHVIINYVTAWNIDQILQKQKSELPKRDEEYSLYTKWFVLSDIYEKLLDWKREKFKLGWQSWISFIESDRLEKALGYYSRRTFKIGREIIPKYEEARAFFKTTTATKKFSAKTSRRNFESIVNKEYSRFERENV